MAELNGMYRHDAPGTKIASPVLISVLIIYSVLQVVRQQVLELYWCHKDKVHLGISPKKLLIRKEVKYPQTALAASWKVGHWNPS